MFSRLISLSMLLVAVVSLADVRADDADLRVRFAQKDVPPQVPMW